MSAEDLLDHFKLDAEVHDQYTLHFVYKPNRVLGRREKVQTKWERGGELGEGAFGQVWQESCRETGGSLVSRAVKNIRKGRMKSYGIDYKKELLALAKFSKEEVTKT